MFDYHFRGICRRYFDSAEISISNQMPISKFNAVRRQIDQFEIV